MNLNHRFALLTGLLFIFIVGCQEPPKKQLPTEWSRVIIWSEDYTQIVINNSDDSTKIKFYDSESFFSGHYKTKVDSSITFFTAGEKDSLFHYAQTIVCNPVQSTHACTDFVGELRLVIQYGRPNFGSFEQSIKYTGVCDWETLSPTTKKLYALLAKHIKEWSKPKTSHTSN